MSESILDSIKKLLGIGDTDTSFDTDVIIHINSAFSTLFQLGVGPKTPFEISDNSAVWEDFTNNYAAINSVKTYVFIKVKLIFDPPTSSFTLQAMKDYADELGWRLKMTSEFEPQQDSDEEPEDPDDPQEPEDPDDPQEP